MEFVVGVEDDLLVPLEGVLAVEAEAEAVTDFGGGVGDGMIIGFVAAGAIRSGLLGLARHEIIVIFL